MKKDVSFDSAGLKLAAHLYAPDSANGARLPAIVIGHPGSGVKEQAAGLYAKLLAEQGYLTLAFDAAYQGESEGDPRGLEDPGQRVEDIKAAVLYLSARDDVDLNRIGVLGICASGGYAITAAVADHRIKAVATISAVDISRLFRLGADGRQPAGVFQSMLEAAAMARTTQARGAPMGVIPLFPDEEQARAGGQHLYEGWEYYCTDRARHERSAKFFTWNSVDRIASSDAFRFIEMISPRPLLMIVGTAALTSWMTADAIADAREPKELCSIDGATHVALYDKDEFVMPAIRKLAEFFDTKPSAASNPVTTPVS
ncbi:alpha/beta hydrolase [Mesorhizobium loti]|uniref:Alpha/beta hydrolase n=1 Tax=Mesorhizobium loti R88b TaxID=935548 RepID=A0A6M7WRI6_RHILI|nr:alpha/beta hydrolase [Mesorhizobium loti]QKD06690.1 alpha/beta hydrolase [Mesorhizobium loti R88b]